MESRRGRGQRWRVVSYSAAPFLALLAVLLFRGENGIRNVAGAFLAVLAVLAILVPLLIKSAR
jgi:drug/metabolite transporter (DMT)-like permease